jgi:hypothetical protein
VEEGRKGTLAKSAPRTRTMALSLLLPCPRRPAGPAVVYGGVVGSEERSEQWVSIVALEKRRLGRGGATPRRERAARRRCGAGAWPRSKGEPLGLEPVWTLTPAREVEGS